MKTFQVSAALLLLVLCVPTNSFSADHSAAQNWPQWRGPEGNGVSKATDLPTAWSMDKNIVWKTPLPSWSGGTPVVWEDYIFVTSPSKAAAPSETPSQEATGGRQVRVGYGGRRDPGGQTLLLLCISRRDGSILWQKDLDNGNRVYNKQNMSSPSPVTNGKHVWTVTGTGAVSAFDMSGKEVWKRNIQADYGKLGLNWGYASSPILHKGNLIIEVLHGNNTTDPSYLVALDGLTGRQVWRVERPTDAVRESPDAYTTPSVLTYNGRQQIVISGGDYVTGHDADTGKEIWRAGGLNPTKSANFRIVNSPVVSDGMIYAGSRKRPLLALKAGGTGDITTSNLVWKWDDRGGPDVPTPVSDGKYFYMVDDSGMVTCLDAKTGKLLWGPERTASGIVSSSPLLADGKIYVVNESAVTSVLAAGPEFKLLSTNELDGSYTLSSIAVSGKQLFVRSSTYLYCIGERPGRSFRYLHASGRPLHDPEQIERIVKLAIPPAWSDVRINPALGGRLQAIGIDAAGRPQYRYHPDFVAQRQLLKFRKIERFGRALPELRKLTNRDIVSPELNRERVLAVVIRLINDLYFRLGSESSVRRYRTYGVTTLRNHHLEIKPRGTLIFKFRGKHHIAHRQVLVDPQLAESVAAIRELPGSRIFQHLDKEGSVWPIRPRDVNDYIKAAIGAEFTAKDFRSWAGTLIAAIELSEIGPPESETQARRNVARVLRRVAERLGNTPAVCRSSYVHPAVIELYHKGRTLEGFRPRAQRRISHIQPGLDVDELALLHLLDSR